ncbi:hypothetical protein PoB_007683700 [Plakobranchus ocellatus]|uniref:Uncharacterized protein n=1 Tax=Plakobranchus ocellatus TaxID=259542 RepID=A0AAV4E206_9GAST|nr:hypothetical protein PoB_007683700 [Plakobranchus ocellatus]
MNLDGVAFNIDQLAERCSLSLLHCVKGEYGAVDVYVEPPAVAELTDCDRGYEDGIGASCHTLCKTGGSSKAEVQPYRIAISNPCFYHKCGPLTYPVQQVRPTQFSLMSISQKRQSQNTGHFYPKETETQNMCALISRDISLSRPYPKTLYRVWKKGHEVVLQMPQCNITSRLLCCCPLKNVKFCTPLMVYPPTH